MRLHRRLSGALVVAGMSLAVAGNGSAPSGAAAGLVLAPTAAHLATQQIDTPTMQPVNVPARIVRVAAVPDSGGAEAWAIGYTSAIVDGWNSSGLGQTVFLHYSRGDGWQIAGPPLSSSGQPSAVRLASLAVAAGGEGWAVGAGGVIVHHAAGDSAWRIASTPVSTPLASVSIAPDGTAYAVGTGFTLLRLPAGSATWVTDPGAPLTSPCSSGAVDLSAVAAVSADEAWAVSGDTSQQLCVIHRSGGSWSVQSTEQQFSQPSGPPSNQAANGEGIAVSNGAVWVVGRMQPSDPTHPLGDTQTGDSSRPFAISIISGTPKSYCPGVMSVDSSGNATETTPCDADFPLAAFGLTSVQAFGDGQVFAGGMGLFHFANGMWQREPDSVGYLTSLSMASPQEGWVAGTGSNAITSAALSESMVVGHWTRQPSVPAMARWPEPGTIPVEGVALSPNGSGAALAVGADGERIRYVPGFGWDLLDRGNRSLHAIAWPALNSAWAVGSAGTVAHWDGVVWNESDAPRNHATDPMTTLYGVAFADAGHGWAVGDDGVLLDYTGGWHRDQASSTLTTQPLYALAYGGGSAVAGGANGTVLVAHGTSWSVDANASRLALAGSPSAATIYSAASLPDGTVALGGTEGLLLVRQPGGSFTRLEPGVDGTVVALGLARDSAGRLEVLASVSPRNAVKYVNGSLSTTDGYLMVRDAGGWHDIELDHQLTMWTSTDTAAAHDPVYAIALEPGRMRGWAVGGYPALTLDDDNRSSERGTTSGSVYRVDLGADPTPPSSLTETPPLPSSGFSFAFLGDSTCAAGVCGAALGSGTKADAVLQEAQREIDESQPDLTFFGGNMRGLGRSQELDVFKRMMKGFSMPAYSAIGQQDLASALNPGDVAPGAPSQPLKTTNTPYLTTFADAPAPWGHGAAPAGVHPVDPAASGNQAATHYAFDYQPPGLPPLVRFIVVNDSETASAGGHTLTATDESPAFAPPQTQLTWLTTELTDAQNKGLQSIVILSAPSDDPRGGTNEALTAAEAPGFDQLITTQKVAAVFAAQINDNVFKNLTGLHSTTEYISGGAGSPLEGTKNSLHGYYHSWLQVIVDPFHLTPDGRATVTVNSMPVLDSVAMRFAYGGGTLPSGNAVQVYGLGRLPDSGMANINGASPDESQSKADYVQVPPDNYGAFPCTLGEDDSCTVPYALAPYHRFHVENDPADKKGPVADFVQPCPSAIAPYGPCIGADGHTKLDEQSGYLCAFRPGKVWVDVVLGVHVAREQLTVTRGFGPCNEALPPVIPPPTPAVTVPDNPVVPQPQAAPVPAPGPKLAPSHRVHFGHTLNNPLVAAVVPPPVPVLAAAPPLPAAGTAAKKEEEREKALQHSSEQSGAGHHAVMRADAEAYWDPRPVAAAGTGALLFLIIMSAWAVGRREPRGAFDERRWE